MMRFFWTILLPMSVTGACAAVLLWLTQPLLHRMGRIQWPAGAVIAVLCLFVFPVSFFIPKLPGISALEAPPSATVPAQNTAEFGTASPFAPPSSAGTSPYSVNTSPFSANAFPFSVGRSPHSADTFFFSADPFSLSAAASSFFQAAGAPSANVAAGAAGTTGMLPAENGGSAAGMYATVLRVVPLFWAAGTVLALLYSAVSYLRFAVRLRRSSRAVTDAAAVAGLQEAQKKSGIARTPELRCTGAITSPLAMGIVCPCIYLPADAPADVRLDYALQHECVHLRKGHLFWKFAAQLVCAVHWFNPAAWLLPRLLNEACEFDCDRAVAAALDDRQRHGYCAALLDAADTGRLPRCVSAFSRPATILRKRIEVVLAPKPRLLKRISAMALCAALVLCAAGLTACAAGQAADSAAELLPSPQSDPALGEKLPQETDPEQTDDPASAPETGAQLLQSGIFWNEPNQAKAELVWPVPGMKSIATGFGHGGHRGTDICASPDAVILAVKGGTVSIAEYHASYGNYVEIDHGDGWKSRYAHCSRLLVQVGDTVSAGQVVACVGATGYSTGYHCHLELIHDETLVDPLSVFGMQENDQNENAGAYAEFSLKDAPQRKNLSFGWHQSRGTEAEFNMTEKILGADASAEERSQFEQNARFWQASFSKPVTVMNEQKGEAYVTLFLCEYEEKLYICDVLQGGFTEGEGWKRISDICVFVLNSEDMQKPPAVTISANFLNGNETESTFITSTFVPTAAEGEWGYAQQG